MEVWDINKEASNWESFFMIPKERAKDLKNAIRDCLLQVAADKSQGDYSESDLVVLMLEHEFHPENEHEVAFVMIVIGQKLKELKQNNKLIDAIKEFAQKLK